MDDPPQPPHQQPDYANPRETDVCLGMPDEEAEEHPATSNYRLMLEFNKRIFTGKSDFQKWHLAESIVNRFLNGKRDAGHFYRRQLVANNTGTAEDGGRPSARARWVWCKPREAIELTVLNLEKFPAVISALPDEQHDQLRGGKRKFSAEPADDDDNNQNDNSELDIENEPLPHRDAAAQRETPAETATRISSSGASNSKKQRSSMESPDSDQVAAAAGQQQQPTPPTVKATNSSSRNNAARHRLAASEDEIRQNSELVGPPPLGNNNNKSETVPPDDDRKRAAARPASQSPSSGGGGDHNSTPRHDNLRDQDDPATMEAADRFGEQQQQQQQQQRTLNNGEPRRSPPRRRQGHGDYDDDMLERDESPLRRGGHHDDDYRRRRRNNSAAAVFDDNHDYDNRRRRYRDPQERQRRGKEHLLEELRGLSAADEERRRAREDRHQRDRHPPHEERRRAREDRLQRDPMDDDDDNINRAAAAAGARLREDQDNQQPLETDEPAAAAAPRRNNDGPPSVIEQRHDQPPNNDDDDHLTEPDLARRPPIGPPARDAADALEEEISPRAENGDNMPPPQRRRGDDATQDPGVGAGMARNRPVVDDDVLADRDRPRYRDDTDDADRYPEDRRGPRRDNGVGDYVEREEQFQRRRGRGDDDYGYDYDRDGYRIPRGEQNFARIPESNREMEDFGPPRRHHSPPRYHDSARQNYPPSYRDYGRSSSDEDEQSVFLVSKSGVKLGKAKPEDLPVRIWERLARRSRPRSNGAGALRRDFASDPIYDSPDDAQRGEVVSGQGEEQPLVHMHRSANPDARSRERWEDSGRVAANVARPEPRRSAPDRHDRRQRNSDYARSEPSRRAYYDSDEDRGWQRDRFVPGEDAYRREEEDFGREEELRRVEAYYNEYRPPSRRRYEDSEYKRHSSFERSHARVARRSRNHEGRGEPYYENRPRRDMQPPPRQQRHRQAPVPPHNDPHDRSAAAAAAAGPQDSFEDRANYRNDVADASNAMRPPPNDLPRAAAAAAAAGTGATAPPINRAQPARHARSNGPATAAGAAGEFGDQTRSSRPSASGAVLRQPPSLEEVHELGSFNLDNDNNTLGSLTADLFDQNPAFQGLADPQQRHTANGASDSTMDAPPLRRPAQHSPQQEQPRPSAGSTNSQPQPRHQSYSQQNARPAAGPPPPDRNTAARNNHPPPGRY